MQVTRARVDSATRRFVQNRRDCAGESLPYFRDEGRTVPNENSQRFNFPDASRVPLRKSLEPLLPRRTLDIFHLLDKCVQKERMLYCIRTISGLLYR